MWVVQGWTLSRATALLFIFAKAELFLVVENDMIYYLIFVDFYLCNRHLVYRIRRLGGILVSAFNL